MSLTSYRAAPPRANRISTGHDPGEKAERDAWAPREFAKEGMIVLGWSGNDLLSRALRHSTIGAEEFNGRVRDGIGFFSPRSNHRTGEGQRQARDLSFVI